jgi:HK97 family phage major capsid protein
MSARSWLKLNSLKDGQGQPLQAPAVLANVRQQYTSQIPNDLTAGTSNDTSLIFQGDFSQAAFIVRERFSVMRSEHIKALTGEVSFIAHARVDVAVNRPGAFSILTGVR